MFKKTGKIALMGGVLAAVSFGGSALTAVGAAPIQPTHAAVTVKASAPAVADKETAGRATDTTQAGTDKEAADGAEGSGDAETADGTSFGHDEADEETSDAEALAVLGGGVILAAGLGWLMAEMLVAMLRHVFDPPPDTLAVPWGFIALLGTGAVAGAVLASIVALSPCEGCRSARPFGRNREMNGLSPRSHQSFTSGLQSPAMSRVRPPARLTQVAAPLRKALAALVPVGALAMVVFLLMTRGGQLLAALVAVPPMVLVGAVSAHILTLVLRTEAWRTVLGASGARRLAPRAVHAANAGAFLAGTVQGQAAMPARIALLRRFGGADAPAVLRIALGDAPIVLFEVCGSAVLATIGSTAVGLIPGWVPWAMLGGALAILIALRALYGRFRDREIAAGLGVLADAGARNRLAAIVAGFTAMAFLRTLIVMAGFDLPTDPAHVCLVLFTMGAVGLLPLGIGTGPAAMVAALGTSNLVTATAAGTVVSAATVLAVLLYGGAVWAWRRPAELLPVPEVSTISP